MKIQPEQLKEMTDFELSSILLTTHPAYVNQPIYADGNSAVFEAESGANGLCPHRHSLDINNNEDIKIMSDHLGETYRGVAMYMIEFGFNPFELGEV